MGYDLLVKLIPPAIALSVLAYFVNFFGRVIADQQPFTDDRKWHIQIAGSTFVINVVFGSTLGIFLANTLSLRIDHWWEHALTFLALSIMGTALYFHNSYESSRLYKYRKQINADIDKKYDGLPSLYAKFGQYVLPAFLPIMVSYIVTLEYLSGNPYLIVLTAIIAFYILLWSAYQLSLRKLSEVIPVDIHFTNKDIKPLLGVQVLKYNDDNIRVRMEDKVLILNKSEVHRIEMQIPKRLL